MKEKFITYYMNIAEETAKLSSAIRLKAGCIAVKDNRILSIGYNGTVSGWSNVCEEVIDGNLITKQEVLHAEMNCLMKLCQSHESSLGATLFITHSPCIHCSKAIYQAGIKRVIYKHDYRLPDGINFIKKCNDIVIEKYDDIIGKKLNL
mgnify:CR=1 FL=1|jgi:dCMP deaminase